MLGVVGPTVSYMAVRAMTFHWYEHNRFRVDDAIQSATGRSILAESRTPGSNPSWLSTAGFGAAGAATGFAVTFIACKCPWSRGRCSLTP
jgi:hypothetical protein